MDDKELLERAARAVGISGRYRDDWDAIERSDYRDSFERGEQWRPHRDDGDAFRLMHEARLDLHHGENEYGEGIITVVGEATCWADSLVCEEHDIAGLRRAIVRAAAMMGEE